MRAEVDRDSPRTAALAAICVLLALALPVTARAQVPGPQRGTIAARTPVYLYPDPKRTPLATLEAGTPVTIVRVENEWFLIRYRDQTYGDRLGYVLAVNVQLVARPESQPPPRGALPPPSPGTTARSAAAQRQTFPRYLGVNALYQRRSSFSGTLNFPLYLETASVATTYDVPATGAVDFALGAGVARHVGVAVAASALYGRGSASASGTLPHPFYFNQPRALSGSIASLPRTELGVHMDLVAEALSKPRMQLLVLGGPTVFVVNQTLASGIQYAEAYPYDTVTFVSADSQRQTKAKVGFNVGVDFTYMMTRKVGVGALARYSRAKVDFTPSNTTVTADVGGPQVGGGIRFRF